MHQLQNCSRVWSLPPWLYRVLPHIDLEGRAPLKPAAEGQSL
jgi:hypothetical protein